MGTFNAQRLHDLGYFDGRHSVRSPFGMNVSAESLSRPGRFATGQSCSALDRDGSAGGSQFDPWVQTSDDAEMRNGGRSYRVKYASRGRSVVEVRARERRQPRPGERSLQRSAGSAKLWCGGRSAPAERKLPSRGRAVVRSSLEITIPGSLELTQSERLLDSIRGVV